MTLASAAAPSPGHVVSFYDGTETFVEEVTNFAVEGLLVGEGVVLVVDGEHRDRIASGLALRGVDAGEAQARGDLVLVDAAATIERIVVDGRLDTERLAHLVAETVDQLQFGRRRVRVFGEMVAMLWDRGHLAGAVELEAAWNQLLHERSFQLMCAYAVDSFSSADLSAATAICDQHAEVAAPSRYPHRGGAEQLGSLTDRSRTFLPASSAVAAVRRFVEETVRAWGGSDVAVDDAMLVASELATNALLHAGSPFRVTLRRAGDTVRLDVEDASPTPPARRSPGVEVTTGRGISMVHAIARRWGTDVRSDGKVVWAELAVSA